MFAFQNCICMLEFILAHFPFQKKILKKNFKKYIFKNKFWLEQKHSKNISQHFWRLTLAGHHMS